MTAATRQQLLIVEPNSSGHHLRYVRQLLDGFVEGDVALLTRHESAHSEEFAAYIEATSARIIELDGRWTWRRVVRKLRSSGLRNVDLVVVPTADKLITVLLPGILSSYARRWRLLYIRSDAAKVATANWVRMLFKRALGRTVNATSRARVVVLSDAFGWTTRRKGYEWATLVADPVHKMRIDLGGSTASKRIGIAGAVDQRKNPLLLLQVVDLLGPGYESILHGKQDRATREALKPFTATRPNIEDRFLSTAELGEVTASLWMAWAVYENDAPSGAIASAIASGVPVVVRQKTWIADVVTGLGIGIAVPTEAETAARLISEFAESYDVAVKACHAAAKKLGVVEFQRVLLGLDS